MFYPGKNGPPLRGLEPVRFDLEQNQHKLVDCKNQNYSYCLPYLILKVALIKENRQFAVERWTIGLQCLQQPDVQGLQIGSLALGLQPDPVIGGLHDDPDQEVADALLIADDGVERVILEDGAQTKEQTEKNVLMILSF